MGESCPGCDRSANTSYLDLGKLPSLSKLFLINNVDVIIVPTQRLCLTEMASPIAWFAQYLAHGKYSVNVSYSLLTRGLGNPSCELLFSWMKGCFIKKEAGITNISLEVLVRMFVCVCRGEGAVTQGIPSSVAANEWIASPPMRVEWMLEDVRCFRSYSPLHQGEAVVCQHGVCPPGGLAFSLSLCP